MRKYFIFLILSLLVTGCTFKLIPNPDTAEVIPAEEVGEVLPEPVPPPPCEIVKGNTNRAGEKIYFTEDSINFDNVKIDEAKGEKFFCSEDEALAAGWRKALR